MASAQAPDQLADALYEQVIVPVQAGREAFNVWLSDRAEAVKAVITQRACAQQRYFSARLGGNSQLASFHNEDVRHGERALRDLEEALRDHVLTSTRAEPMRASVATAFSAVESFRSYQSGYEAALLNTNGCPRQP